MDSSWDSYLFNLFTRFLLHFPFSYSSTLTTSPSSNSIPICLVLPVFHVFYPTSYSKSYIATFPYSHSIPPSRRLQWLQSYLFNFSPSGHFLLFFFIFCFYFTSSLFFPSFMCLPRYFLFVYLFFLPLQFHLFSTCLLSFFFLFSFLFLLSLQFHFLLHFFFILSLFFHCPSLLFLSAILHIYIHFSPSSSPVPSAFASLLYKLYSESFLKLLLKALCFYRLTSIPSPKNTVHLLQKQNRTTFTILIFSP